MKTPLWVRNVTENPAEDQAKRKLDDPACIISRNRSRVQRLRGLGLKIDMPSASPHSSLPATELALE